MTTPEPSTQITLREVYDLCLETSKLVATLVAVGPKVDDHEARIRTLERTRWALAGVCTALGAAAGTIATMLGKA